MSGSLENNVFSRNMLTIMLWNSTVVDDSFRKSIFVHLFSHKDNKTDGKINKKNPPKNKLSRLVSDRLVF